MIASSPPLGAVREVLLWSPDYCCKSARVDTQLAVLDVQTEHVARDARLRLLPDHAHHLIGLEPATRFTPELVKKLCKQRQAKVADEVLEVLVGTNSGH